MNLALRLGQSQRLATSAQMRLALDVLSMSNAALGEFLQAEAAANPFLDLAWPAPAGAGPSGEVPDRAEETGLIAHVLAQIPLCVPDGAPRRIALHFVEALEPTGWLGQPVAEIAAAAGCSSEAAEAVLAALQRMEPAGLFARDLRECLWLQAIDRGLDSPAMAGVLDHLPLAAGGDLAALAAAAGVSRDAAAACLAKIRRMDPKPGARFAADPTLARAPDLVVTRERGAWQVALNRSELPAIRVTGLSAGRRLDPALSGVLKAATWLQRAVQQRNRTTLAVAAELVRRQTGFLESGPPGLSALRQRDVALALGLHESTVSRVVAGLTIATPRGVIAVKDLFSHGGGPDGAGPSAAALRHRIAALIRTEDTARPLSDAAIADRLAAEGVTIARRTVTKHREALRLPPAPARRQPGAPAAAHPGRRR